jgi:hypothetical protein
MKECAGDDHRFDLTLILVLSENRVCRGDGKQRSGREDKGADRKRKREYTAGVRHGGVPFDRAHD